MGTQVGSIQDEVGTAQRDALITGSGWHPIATDLQSGLARFRELGLNPKSQDAGNPQQHFPGALVMMGQSQHCCLPSAPASAQADTGFVPSSVPSMSALYCTS